MKSHDIDDFMNIVSCLGHRSGTDKKKPSTKHICSVQFALKQF